MCPAHMLFEDLKEPRAVLAVVIVVGVVLVLGEVVGQPLSRCGWSASASVVRVLWKI